MNKDRRWQGARDLALRQFYVESQKKWLVIKCPGNLGLGKKGTVVRDLGTSIWLLLNSLNLLATQATVYQGIGLCMCFVPVAIWWPNLFLRLSSYTSLSGIFIYFWLFKEPVKKKKGRFWSMNQICLTQRCWNSKLGRPQKYFLIQCWSFFPSLNQIISYLLTKCHLIPILRTATKAATVFLTCVRQKIISI